MDGQRIVSMMSLMSNDPTVCSMKSDRIMLCRWVAVPVLAAMVVAGCGVAKPAAAPSQPPASLGRHGASRQRADYNRAAGTHVSVSGGTGSRPGRRNCTHARFQGRRDVKAGQRLYQIDPAPYIAALNSAKASLQKAEANLVSTAAQAERYKVLVAANAVSKQDYDNAVAAQGQAAADVAPGKATVAMAQINLGYTNVMSPITGRSGLSQVTKGAYVQASAATLMTTVQQIDPIYVDLTQSSVEGLQLRRDIASGQLKLSGPDQAKVTLTLEDGTNIRWRSSSSPISRSTRAPAR